MKCAPRKRYYKDEWDTVRYNAPQGALGHTQVKLRQEGYFYRYMGTRQVQCAPGKGCYKGLLARSDGTGMIVVCLLPPRPPPPAPARHTAHARCQAFRREGALVLLLWWQIRWISAARIFLFSVSIVSLKPGFILHSQARKIDLRKKVHCSKKKDLLWGIKQRSYRAVSHNRSLTIEGIRCGGRQVTLRATYIIRVRVFAWHWERVHARQFLRRALH